jgi:hypothetical protein
VEASVYIPLANGKRERETESPDNVESSAAGELDPCLPVNSKLQQSDDEIDSAPVKVKSKLHSSNNSLNKKKKAKGGEDAGRSAHFVRGLEEQLRQKTGLSRRGLVVAGVVILLLVVALIVIIALASTWPRTPHSHLFPVCTRAACLQASAEVSTRLCIKPRNLMILNVFLFLPSVCRYILVDICNTITNYVALVRG